MPALNMVDIHGITFNIHKGTLACKKCYCKLTNSQIGILRILLTSKKPLCKYEIFRKLSGCTSENSIPVLICGIRNRIIEMGFEENIILTTKNKGYFIRN